MKEKHCILVINTGSTSTKIAVFEGENPIFTKNLKHNPQEISNFPTISSQYEFRKKIIIDNLKKNGFSLADFDAVVGRGGLLHPLSGGTYRINQQMVEDLEIGPQGQHASNLAGIITYGIGWDYRIPTFVVDPPTVDEFEPVAHISGLPQLPRRSLVHALNIKAVARQVADHINKDLSEVNFIVAHLGGGISICALRQGRIIDTSNGLGSGPMTPERAGELPTVDLVDLCFSGKYTYEKIKKMLVGKGGLVAHLGTSDAKAVEELVLQGDKKAGLVYEAMGYQSAKFIGMMAAVLCGEIDGIVLTGGLAYSPLLIDIIKQRVGFLAPIYVFPGEDEMKALALGCLRVLNGEEEPKDYYGLLNKEEAAKLIENLR